MELRTTIWLVVYIVLALLVYLGYGIGIAANEFPNKNDPDRLNAIWRLFGVSLLLFAIAATLHILTDQTVIAVIFLMLSIFCDIITSLLIGTTNATGKYSVPLSYVSISPIVYKLILFMFLNWEACDKESFKSFETGLGRSSLGESVKSKFDNSRLSRFGSKSKEA